MHQSLQCSSSQISRRCILSKIRSHGASSINGVIEQEVHITSGDANGLSIQDGCAYFSVADEGITQSTDTRIDSVQENIEAVETVTSAQIESYQTC